ncbi:FlgO family outer membrane protein [Thiovibrio sp. JS02]
MRKTIIISALAALFTASPATGDDSGAPAAAGGNPVISGGQVRPVPVYRPYFYNYPHALPPDYVFRTARVFSPHNLALPLPGGGKGAGGAGALPDQGAALKTAITQLGKALLVNAREDVVDEYVVAVSTFVNLDNLYATSSLGRYLGEQFIGELQQAGVEVVEVRKTPGMMISEHHGEYGLSRDMDELGFVQSAQAMVVGTYTVTEQEVLVNVRLLRNEDNMVLSTANAVLPLGSLTAGMLANESMPAVAIGTSRVTVRQFPEK